ncbi:MAG: hypothetical protein HYX22_02210 [Candidatus Yanofskybacteria bacterium]|nr:hypothetical protein [Candidatus Yanofskybacteria bacterium]
MRRIWLLCLTLSVSSSLFWGCEPPTELNRNIYRDENFFPLPGDLKNTSAFLVLEWNGRKPWIMASGNLIDKKEGLIRTAKHFTDDFGKLGLDYCRVFLMNGKIYKATLTKVTPIRDAAIIKLIPPFSPDDFTDPLLSASEMPKFGDTVYVQGLHPHAYDIRRANKEEGFSDQVVNIFETYYGQLFKDTSQELQVVFDNLEGKRVKPDPDSIRNNPWLSVEDKKALLEFENDRYIKVLTARDHKSPFSGLSGGVALNGKGEAFGVITAQNPMRFEIDDQGLFFIPGIGPAKMGEVKKQFWDTIYITPLDSIKDLDKYPQN